jgi:hypothetical protein
MKNRNCVSILVCGIKTWRHKKRPTKREEKRRRRRGKIKDEDVARFHSLSFVCVCVCVGGWVGGWVWVGGCVGV